MFIVLILVLIIIYLMNKHNMFSYPVIESNVSNVKPLYFNVNMKDICSSAAKQDDKNVEKKSEKMTACEKQVRQACPPEKTTEDLLFEERKKYNELKLKYEDDSAPYSVYKDDRYLFSQSENATLTGDDKLVIKMKDSGGRAQEAIINRAKFDKNSLLPYFMEELEDHANANGWWEDETLEQLM